MAQVILDFGSGNTCKNNIDYIARMIDTVAAMDSHRHEVIFKWQLFENEPWLAPDAHHDIPLTHAAFKAAYLYAKNLGYKTTSSVFDKPSLDFLLTFDIPFVKIACRPSTYWLLGEIPRKVEVYLSWDGRDVAPMGSYTRLFCMPKYPAPFDDYPPHVKYISDHTEGLRLWNRNKPEIWEKHFILEDDPTNPDAAGHAIKPDLLREVIGD